MAFTAIGALYANFDTWSRQREPHLRKLLVEAYWLQRWRYKFTE